MNSDYEKFIQFLQQNKFRLLRKWIADPLSSYSDLPIGFQLRGPKLRAKDSLCIYFFSLNYEPWYSDRIVNLLRQECYSKQYNGGWKILQDFLEEVTNIETFVQKYIQVFGGNDFYGNFVPRLNRLHTAYTLQPQKESKVKKPKRKRGYDDKGSLRPPHQRGRVYGKEDNLIDRRSKVQHPLLGEDSAGSGITPLNSSQKGAG